MFAPGRRHFCSRTLATLQRAELSRCQLAVTSPATASQARGYHATSLQPPHLTTSSPYSTNTNHLNQLQRHFSTSQNSMSQTNNADFQLSNVFDVKGKVSCGCSGCLCHFANSMLIGCPGHRRWKRHRTHVRPSTCC